MKKMLLVLLVMSMTAGAVLGTTPAAGENKAQFALTLSGLFLQPDTGSSRSVIGPGLRVDLDLGRSLILAPEASVGAKGLCLGGTLNYRYREFFIGAGGGLVYFFEERQDIRGSELLKIQVGAKGLHWLVAVSYASNIGGWLKGFSLTAGYLF